MPRWEGPPNQPCPRNVNNSSVKNSIADLFLCPECEEVHFPTKKAEKKIIGKEENRTPKDETRAPPKKADKQEDLKDCDAPAHAFVKCIKPHTAYNSCERCMQRGECCDKIILPDLSASKRTDETFRSALDVDIMWVFLHLLNCHVD